MAEQTETISHASIVDKISKLAKLRATMIAEQDNYSKKFSLLDTNADARFRAFAMWSNVLASIELSLVLMHEHLMDDKWWEPRTVKEYHTQAFQDTAKHEYLMLAKISLVQGMFMVIETSIRLFVRAIDPTKCNYGRTHFSILYNFLLKRLGLITSEPALEVLKDVRNALHNNGVFFPMAKGDVTIEYGGRSLKLIDGRHINFASWDFLLDLASVLQQLLLDMLKHPDLSDFPFVSSGLE